ncbi:hypothetical protein [Nocardioides cavernaquae]|uniref:Uncharacterized protein n=1 Tax=Nocardioides cavernaquae TaxID=2321396 RepID=A0A3A5H758_9ACTN|nr:hypothetical protein [Nocardioides cavernaquae]RJS46499.1 hypothetical protein D4739_09930 [Nocardioides cavernaquae]
MDRAEQLLDAHVAHELRQLQGDNFTALVASEVDYALAAAATLTLDQVMHRDQVKAVAVKYVATFRLPGAIPEIATDIATLVRHSPANDVALGTLVSRPRIEELVSVIAEMRSVRIGILRGIADSSSLQAGVGGLVRGVATGAIGSGRRWISRVPGATAGSALAGMVAGQASRAPGVARVGEAVDGLVSPVVEGVDQRSREFSERAARMLLGYLSDNAAVAVTDDEFRQAALEIWDTLATSPVRVFMDAVTDDQLVDLFVAAYQAWLDLRTSDYLPALVEAGVDVFFDTYRDFTLDKLLEEFGLGAADLVEEALRFAPPVIEAMLETGLLEELIRRRLASFYLSDEGRALING